MFAIMQVFTPQILKDPNTQARIQGQVTALRGQISFSFVTIGRGSQL